MRRIPIERRKEGKELHSNTEMRLLGISLIIYGKEKEKEKESVEYHSN